MDKSPRSTRCRRRILSKRNLEENLMKIHNEPKTIRKGSTIAALCFLFAMGTMGDVMAQESDTLKFPMPRSKRWYCF